MIITCKKEVPARWIIFTILPWAASTFNRAIMGVAFLFSLKKFISNPAGVTFILSLPGFVSLITAPVASFVSDRIWTRFGRRKPFVIISWTGSLFCLGLMPLMPNFWFLLAAFLLLNLFTDLSSPLEALKQEIVPPHERGRATGGMAWCSNLGFMTFYFFALGRFDDVTYMAGHSFDGELAIYWSGGLLLIVMLFLLMLGIKEIDQKSALLGQKLSIKSYFSGLLDRELWPVYLMVPGFAILSAGLGPLSNLLATEQWGYSKQEMGVNMVAGGVINMFMIGLLTIFADKLNRKRAYQTLLCASVIINFCYYFYIHLVLPDQHPTLVEMIVFGETLSILGILTNMVYYPLVYDYITRNKMGTYVAGSQMVTRLIQLITLNGVGLFVWGYAVLFQPPAGEMTRVVLRGEQNHQAEIRSLLRSASWKHPDSGAPVAASNINVLSWQADGTVSEEGRCWEIRLRDPDSEKLAAEREALTLEKSSLVAGAKILSDQAEILRHAGKPSEAAIAQKKADGENEHISALSARSATLDAELSSRSDQFHAQVAAILGPRLLVDGDQVLNATSQQALVVEMASTARIDGPLMEKALYTLRHERPGFIDLRPVKITDDGYGVEASAIVEPGKDPASLAQELQASVERVFLKIRPGLFPIAPAHALFHIEPAVTLDLMIVEEPVVKYVSPITRVVNAILSLFDRAPHPDHRLSAMARILCVPTEINHVRATPGMKPKTLSITAVLPASAPRAAGLDDPVGKKLQQFLQGKEEVMRLSQVRAFYDHIVQAAATQRLTVAQPSIASAYAPMKYDYTSGYIWMFMLGVIGITVTFIFSHLEAAGYIRKRGVEEAEAS